MAPELTNRMGHRNVTEGRNGEGWGGKRIKNFLVAEVRRWIHPHTLKVKSQHTAEVLRGIFARDTEHLDESKSESSQGE